jgi:hypothetical protein
MAHYGIDLLSTSNDLLTSLDRGAVALNMIAHTLENEFAERFGHTGVRTTKAHQLSCIVVCSCKQWTLQ